MTVLATREVAGAVKMGKTAAIETGYGSSRGSKPNMAVRRYVDARDNIGGKSVALREITKVGSVKPRDAVGSDGQPNRAVRRRCHRASVVREQPLLSVKSDLVCARKPNQTRPRPRYLEAITHNSEPLREGFEP